MRDFVAHVRRHLPRGDVPEDRYDDMVDELAAELDARYTARRRRGSTDEEAWQDVLAQVPSWPLLARDLAAAGAGSRRPKRPSPLRASFTAERWLRSSPLASGCSKGSRVHGHRGGDARGLPRRACGDCRRRQRDAVPSVARARTRSRAPDGQSIPTRRVSTRHAARHLTTTTGPARHGLRGQAFLQLLQCHDRDRRGGDPHARDGGHAVALPPPARQSGAWPDFTEEEGTRDHEGGSS